MQNTQVVIRQIIAKRLKLAREKAGFSLPEDFCKAYNFELVCYKKHEEGCLSMRASEMKQYCLALKISIVYLILGETSKKLKKDSRLH